MPFIIIPLTTQQELGNCSYLFHRLLGPRCPLVNALQDLIVTVEEYLSSFLVQMATINQCTAFVFGVSCVINAYLNTCIKASTTASLSDPGGRTLASSQFIIDKLDHRRYLRRTLPTSLRQFIQV